MNNLLRGAAIFAGLLVMQLVGSAASSAANWSAQSSGTSSQLYGISCPTVTSCWAVGDYGTITATTTGGAAGWGVQGTGPMLTPGWDSFRGISCPNATTCVASGTMSAGTQTAGVGQYPVVIAWMPEAVGPSGANGVSCPAPGVCWSVGDGIFSTLNNGQSWTGWGVAQGLHGVSCATVSACVAVGDYGQIAETSDSVESWTKVSSGTSHTLRGVSCDTASTCVAVGDGGTILASADGGQTWTAQASGTSADLYGVSCVSEVCTAVGSGGTILTGTDTPGAVSIAWTAEASHTAATLTAVSCPSPTVCWATGGNKVFTNKPV